jgi:hypothetical protein
MIFISDHYNNVKCLKITNECTRMLYKSGGNNRSGFESRNANENIKYVTQMLGGTR